MTDQWSWGSYQPLFESGLSPTKLLLRKTKLLVRHLEAFRESSVKVSSMAQDLVLLLEAQLITMQIKEKTEVT